MKVSLKWLRQLVEFDGEPEAIADALTMAGFEVEDIDDRRALADGVVVGKILTAEPHPNADRLQVCKVDVGQAEPLTIVCGAANARANLWVPVAVAGTYLPAIALKLRKTKLRGVPSEGMICSLKELGLEKESEGIHEFDGTPTLGSDVRPLLGLDDAILDLTSTANRADALSMVGIAREVAALTRQPVCMPHAAAPEPTQPATLQLDIADATLCPAYSASLIRGVRIGPSPLWLQQQLESAGLRSINNVVDATNYILLEWGQPLHAFDWQRLQAVMGKVKSPTLGVRLAKAGETLRTLDGTNRPLAAENLVITAQNKPVALAGVMGGEDTEVNDASVDILLEAALFEPFATRRSARAQSLRTEASARYERGIDASAWLTARDRAVAMILELAGGELLEQAVFDARPMEDRTIRLRLQRLRDVLGDEVAATDVEDILTALGFTLSEGDPSTWDVRVPPYRQRDIEREIDLIEEFARLYGYDRFPERLPTQAAVGDLSTPETRSRQVREALRGTGLTELMQISLCPQSTGVPVAIANPIAEEFSALRQDMLPGLIEAFASNLDRGNGPLNGFEIGRIFWRENGAYREADRVAGILGGNPTCGDWQKRSQPLDWFAAKGIVAKALQRLGLAADYKPKLDADNLHPGRTASLWLGDRYLGVFGQLHPQLRRERDLPDEVYAFQLDLNLLIEAMEQRGTVTYRAFSTFPASDRDIAFFSPVALDVASLEQAIAQSAGELLESVELFDDYRGKGVPAGQRSLAFRLIYRAGDRTLTDSEVETAHQKVREHLEKTFQVSLRS